MQSTVFWLPQKPDHVKHNHLQVQRLLADIHWLQQQVNGCTRHSHNDGTSAMADLRATPLSSGDEAGRLATGGRANGAVGWGGRVMGDGGAGMVAISHRGLVDQMSLKTAGTDTSMHATDAAGHRLLIHISCSHAARTHTRTHAPSTTSAC